MEIDKVIRILAVALVIITFAIRIATRLLFPDCEPTGNFAIAALLVICLLNIWRTPARDKRHDQ
ncbi:hypothetical protein [uncultured Alistipes sp.]|uniref:hypothetical protein n=1 Tax=uncultured Alistipes sp. TaxID=538949 RepID=UPI002805CC6E|nr:hypothetical protein [uncultured Alistipes sp.]